MEESHGHRCSEAKLAKVSPFGATRINLRFSSEPKKGIEDTGDFSRIARRLRITIAAGLSWKLRMAVVLILTLSSGYSLPSWAATRVSPRSTLSMAYVTQYEQLSVKTGRTVSMVDITKEVAAVVAKSGCVEGTVTVLSKHSTVGVMINEFEERFVSDARQWLQRIAPPSYPWLHNDIDFRAGPPGYPGGDDAWRAMRMQEPPNAHSHIIQFVVGTSETVPIHEGKMTIGTFQNIIIVDADGPAANLGSPKSRTICVQVQGCNGK